MKKFLFLFTVLATLFLGSCKDEVTLNRYQQFDGIVYYIVDSLDLEVSHATIHHQPEYKGDIVISTPIYTLLGIEKDCKVIGVGESAFYNCTELTSVSFPSTIRYVKKNAFSNCTMLKSITIRSINPPTIDPTAFEGCKTENITLYVFIESVDAYKKDEIWGKLNVKPYPLEDA